MLADSAESGAQVAALRPRSRPAKDTDPPSVYIYSLRYSSPDREPPDGMARVQLAVPAGRGAPGMPPGTLARWRELGGPGCGWSICVQDVEPPAKVRSQERRATKKAPLFAEQIVERERVRRPGYFGREDLRLDLNAR